MKDVYEIIELQFYRDLNVEEDKFCKDKNEVEKIMKEHSVDYALEIVENAKRNHYEQTYIKGYTLNLIIKKIDLHYVLKLLDENKISFFASEEEKRNAIRENEIQYEEYEEYEEAFEEDSNTNYKKNELDSEEIKKRNEVGDAFVRAYFIICFSMLLFLDVSLAYWLYTNKLYDYLFVTIVFIAVQLWLFKLLYGKFKKKVEHL